MNLIENKERIFSQVAQAMETANRTDQVNVIAVTKYVGIDQANALVDTGVRHIGENRVDKFLEKYQALKDEGLTWHLIGSLQRRKRSYQLCRLLPCFRFYEACPRNSKKGESPN